MTTDLGDGREAVLGKTADTLETIYDELRADLPDERLALALPLATAAYRRMSGSQMAELDPQQAAARIIAGLEMFEQGDGAVPLLQVEPTDDSTLVHLHIGDGPFVVSTVTAELNRLGLDAEDLAHPVVGVERDEDGTLRAIGPARQADRRETYLLLDLRTKLDGGSRTAVRRHLRDVLDDALNATRDFGALKSQIASVAEEVEERGPRRYSDAEVGEAAAFLHWLLDDYFVILGFRSYDVRGEGDAAEATVTPGSGLGILTDVESSRFAQPVKLSDLEDRLLAQTTDGPLLTISRTNRLSTVHRQQRMMYVGIQKLDANGQLVGEHRILGLLGQKAFVEPSSTIPVLRTKLRHILDLEDVVDHSHDERALRTLFDSFPKQELFETPAEDLRATLVQLLDDSDNDRVRVLLRNQPDGRSVSVLVTMPRERFSGSLRRDVQSLLTERSGAIGVDYQLSMTERDEPLLHFTLHLPADGPSDPLDAEDVELGIRRMLRTFEDELGDALAADRDPGEAVQVARLWCACLPAAYTQHRTVEDAVLDIGHLEALDGPQAVRMWLLPRGDGLHRFRLYKAGDGVELSGFLPMLESMGLVVVEQQPTLVEDAPVWGRIHIHDYGVRIAGGDIDMTANAARIAAAAKDMWHGREEVDSLNRLVVNAGLEANDVGLLRAYRRYIRQVGTTYTEQTINDTLVEHPDVASALLGYFVERFDPDRDDDDREEAARRDDVLRALEHVARLDQDRILRSFLGMIDATLRTNAFQRQPWLSLKLDSSRVPGVPKPVPYREIFVYNPQMEGVHLRGGPVARGGLRWSDRLDDFRTEVLGLMKAQMTKNSVIVPTGSKGGFVLKHRPDDHAALREEVEKQYRTFIKGLLDITDNIVDGEVVGPPDVVRTDGDDPYLVVAADRGTATFSDIANSISADYGFWLDDAFASGGSQGYDHKAMGITARGAWVAVQRHFRQLSIDVQTDPITIVGIGDMSGDVFGNGLLRSRAVKLVAAFDHRDVFIDPTPDPETSYDERQRLYDVPRSSWQDYDREKFSAGGGVWSRTAKKVPLSEEARHVLRIDAEELSPPELLHAILKAPVDLIWFGGIGTYIKAKGESNSDVGDRANDAIRVDADEVAARVLGEGGNLAVTQQGRIAYARRGGKCNTDAIDNAAGVNTSDREVNLKILLSVAIRQGELAEADRNDFLESLTSAVADQVLRDSYLQTWSISQELAQAPGGIGAYEQLMGDLEKRGRLDREVEWLPDTREVAQRQEHGAGLTRPELAVLLGYAKVDLMDALLDSELIDQAAFEPVRVNYFPGEAAERFGPLTDQHRLRRELVAMVVANEVCNRLGITWARRSAADLGVNAAQMAAGYWAARRVIGAEELWRQVEALDYRADPQLQLEMKNEIDSLVDAFARSFVRQARVADIEGTVAADRPAFVELAARLPTSGSQGQRLARRRRADRWIDLGLDEDLSEKVAGLREMTLVPGIAASARASGRSIADCAHVYNLIAERLPLDRVSLALREYSPHGRWERWQHRGLVDDLRRLHHAAARSAIADGVDSQSPQDLVTAFLDARAETVERAVGLARQVQDQPTDDLNALAVAVRALSEIAA